MRRGDLVTVASSGDYGKPRPALIIQADAFAEHPSITLLPLTSELIDAPMMRIAVQPDRDNGLERRSHIMIDKATTVPLAKVGRRIGRLDAATLASASGALAIFLGLA